MRTWSYQILDKDSETILREDGGFETESDAELQAEMEAKADNIRNIRIRTYQPPYNEEEA